MNFKLNLIEIILQLIIAVLTIIIQPPNPLLGIPFLMIITMRTIFSKLEDSK